MDWQMGDGMSRIAKAAPRHSQRKDTDRGPVRMNCGRVFSGRGQFAGAVGGGSERSAVWKINRLENRRLEGEIAFPVEQPGYAQQMKSKMTP